jgi:hypothetical protein
VGAVARSSRRRAPLGSRSQRISGPGSLASVVHAAGCRAAELLAIARHRDLGEVVAPRATALMTLPSLNGVVGSGIARNLKRLGRRDQARSQIGTSLRPRRTGRDGFPSSGSPVLSLALSCFAVFGVLGGSSDVLLRRLRLLLGQPAMASGLLRFASGLEEISCVGLGLGWRSGTFDACSYVARRRGSSELRPLRRSSSVSRVGGIVGKSPVVGGVVR